MSQRGHKPASQYTNITDRMDNSFYSGAVNIGYLNLGLVVGNAMQIVGLHSLIAIRTPLTVTTDEWRRLKEIFFVAPWLY